MNNFRIIANGFGRKFFEFLICLTGVSLDEHHWNKYNMWIIFVSLQMFFCTKFFEFLICLTGVSLDEHHWNKYNMWIIFVSLQSLRQPSKIRCKLYNSCDLLLFSYLCKVLDNSEDHAYLVYGLWFAFIFVSLQSLRQLRPCPLRHPCGCDLLLFSYLCKVLDNVRHLRLTPKRVVICFYFRIFAKS